MIAILFYNPTIVPFGKLLWLLLPLCASVAIVYKTVRTDNVRKLHIEVLVLLVYILLGLIALGAGLWAIHTYWL